MALFPRATRPRDHATCREPCPKNRILNHQVRKHASSIRTLVLLGVAVLAPLSALWLLRLAEVHRCNDASLTWGASKAAHLDQCSMGGGADCEVDATYTTPEARSVGSFRSPILRTTQPDSRNIVGPPSKGRRTSAKLIGTLLATVAAAPVALAVRGFQGTASSPKAMGRVLVHFAMLSTASGWKLPSEQSAEPEMTITGEAHESPITGGVNGARDRRRLASNCNSGWCVCPPRPCFPSLRNLAAAFLSAADHTARRQTATLPRITALAVVATKTVGLAAMPAVLATIPITRLPTVDATVIPLTQAVAHATPPATPAVPVALLGHTAPRSTSLVARACALAEPPPRSPRPRAPCPRSTTTTRTTTRTTHAPPHAPHHHTHRTHHHTRNHTPTNGRTCAQGRGRTFVTLPAPLRRARALRVRPAPHHSTSIAPARVAAKPTTPSAIRV